MAIAIWVLLALSLTACGDDDDDVAPDGGDAAVPDGGDPDGGDPDGGDPDASVVLPDAPLAMLEGDADDLAADVLPDFGPVISTAFDDEGRLTQRIVVMLDPTATVEEVNAALDARDLGIAQAAPPSLVVSLATPELTTRSDAEALIEALKSDGLVLIGWPAYPMSPDLNPQEDDATFVLTNSGQHLLGPRFPGAWNAFGLASGAAAKVTVLVPDTYFTLGGGTPEPHDFIPTQRFAPGSLAVESSLRTTFHEGNHGYWTSGILGATFDSIEPTGTSPDPVALLDVLSIDAAHPNTVELVALLGLLFPASGHSIVSASYGYNDLDFTRHPLIERATAALAWRVALLESTNPPFVLGSSGNDGDEIDPPPAELNSPFTTQARFDDLRDLFPSGDPALAAFEVEWARMIDHESELDTVQGSTLVVGGSNRDGTPWPGSTPGHDVRMVAEQVVGPCVVHDELCSDMGDRTTVSDGTSASTPAAAGAAAYIWSLDPTQSQDELRQRLLDAHDRDRWIDVFNAALSLEEDGGPAVRKAIVDVEGGAGGRGNGTFDELDLDAITAALAAHDATPNAMKTFEWSRSDLNGDGYTRSDTKVVLDLDFNGEIAQAQVTMPGDVMIAFDEDEITDLDFLCFMAYGPAYTGDTAHRDELLGGDCLDANDGAIAGPSAYEGTVTYTVDTMGLPEGAACGMPGVRRVSSRTLTAMVHCAAFDPHTSIGPCQFVEGTGSVSMSFMSTTPWSTVIVSLGGGACASDSDCGAERCITINQCMTGEDPANQPGSCGRCEAYRRTETNVSGTRSGFDISAIAGSFIVSLGTTSGGVTGASIHDVAVDVGIAGTSTTTTMIAGGDCSDVTAGAVPTPIGFNVPLAAGITGEVLPISITSTGITGGGGGTIMSGVDPETSSMASYTVSIDLHVTDE